MTSSHCDSRMGFRDSGDRLPRHRPRRKRSPESQGPDATWNAHRGILGPGFADLVLVRGSLSAEVSRKKC